MPRICIFAGRYPNWAKPLFINLLPGYCITAEGPVRVTSADSPVWKCGAHFIISFGAAKEFAQALFTERSSLFPLLSG
jgi:hypothetical protein